MSKLRKASVIIVAVVLLVQLLSVTAFAGEQNVYNAPDNTFFVEIPAYFVNSSSGLRFTVNLGVCYALTVQDFATLIEEHQPVLEIWTYIGDSFFFESQAFMAQDIQCSDETRATYTSLVVDLPDSDNVYVEVTWDNGIQGMEYERNMNGWRPTRFDDVSRKDWYYRYVDYAANVLGLINGKGAGTYVPDDNMTCAEAIALAARMHCRFLRLTHMYDFQPIPGKPWYQPYLDYAAQYGIPCEYTNYNATISRAEYAHIFFAAFPEIPDFPDDFYYQPINNIAEGSIPDVPANHPYADEIYALYRAGIITGSDAAHSFKPNDSIKRSEVAAIVCRMCDYDRQEFSLG